MRRTVPLALVLGLVAAASAARAEEPAKSAVAFVPGLESLDDVLAKAKTEAKPAFLDVYSPT